jgi:DNA processing protein
MSEIRLQPDEALALSIVGGPTVPRLLPLLKRFGGLNGVLSQPPDRLMSLKGVGPGMVSRIRRAATLDVAAARRRLEGRGVTPLIYGCAGYPEALYRDMNTPPLALYVKGDPNALGREAVAIVGTRRPTAGAIAITRRLAGDLGGLGLSVVSGLATGIDGLAHQGCLEAGGVTVAVLAHGLQTVQPSGHRTLARRILENGGALVTEYAWGVSAQKHTFVPRNRIIAGLSEATVVVEGAERSGARHSAAFAADYGRVVLAVPGRPSDPQAALPNLLIREKRAELCRDAADVLASLRPDQVDGVRRALDARATILARHASNALKALGPQAERLLRVMGGDPVNVDELCARTGMQASVVLVLLIQLEIEGIVEQLPGMRYLPNYRPS